MLAKGSGKMNKKQKNILFKMQNYWLIICVLLFTCCTSYKQKHVVEGKSKKDSKAQSLKVLPPSGQKSHMLKKLYTANKLIYLPDLICKDEFCTLYVMSPDKVVFTKIFVKGEIVEVEIDGEGIYYVKLMPKDVLPPKKLKHYDYKVIYDKTMPVLQVKTKILDKQVFRSNSTIKVCYTSFDKNPKQVKVWFSDSYKKKIEPFSDKLPKKGCFNFALPGYSTVIDLYFRAEDKCGNFSSQEKLTIFVDGEAPDIVVDVPDITNNAGVNISYTVFDRGLAGFDFAEIYVKGPFLDLKKVGRFYNFKDKINYTFDKEGIYFFSLKAYDKVGNVSISEEKKVIYDSTPPRLSVEGLDRDIFYTGEKIKLKLTVEDENPSQQKPNVFLSPDNGKDWRLLEFQSANDNIFLDVPDIFTKEAILRIEVKDKAGNTGFWESNLFAIDNVIPACEVVEKPYFFRSNEISLEYKIIKSGIKTPDKVKLFYKKENEKELKLHDFVDKYKDKLDLTLPDGIYKIGIICIDTKLEELGKVQSLKNIKLVGVVVDTQSPKLLAISKLKRYYKNADTIKIEWHFTDDNPPENNQVLLMLSYDNKNFTPVRKDFQYVDSFSYTISTISRELHFKIIAKDSLNNVTTVTRSIKIDNSPPHYKFSIRKVSNITTVPFSIKLYDKGSGIKDAYIHIRKRGEEKWDIADVIYHIKRKNGVINFKESGYYQVKVTVFDWAGNSTESSRLSIFDSEVLVDTVFPAIDIESDRLEYYTGEVMSMKTKISDNIGIKNIKVFLSINNSPFKVVDEDYKAGGYVYRFKEAGVYIFKFMVTDHANNFVVREVKVNVKKPHLNFPCPLPSVLKEKNFVFPCKFDVASEIIPAIYIYIRREGEKEFKEFAEYSKEKEYTLPEGCYEIDIVGRDIEGNTGIIGSTASKICVAYTLPVINFLQPNKLIYNGTDSFIDLKWQVEAVEVKKANLNLGYSQDDGKTYTAILKDSNMIDSFKFPLSQIRNYEGFVHFKVTITDITGTVAEGYLKNIYYDDLPPRIKLNSEFKKWYGQGEKIPLKYCIEDFDKDRLKVKLYQSVNGNEYFLVKSGMNSCDTVDLELKGDEGYNIFRIIAEDSAGNTSIQETPKLYIDSSKPVLLLNTQTKINEKVIKFFIKGEDKESGINNIILYRIIDSQLVAISEFKEQKEKEYKYMVTEDGYYKFLARAYDKVGNMGESNIVDVLVDTTQPIINVSKFILQETHLCGIHIDLSVNFTDNISLDYVKVSVLQDDITIIDKLIRVETNEYTYKEILPNTLDRCKDYRIRLEAKDTGGNVAVGAYTIKNIRPVLAYKIDFGGENIKAGNISYKVNIPDDMRKYVERLELFGKKVNDTQYVSFGKIQSQGTLSIVQEGCYEFAVVGCLKKDVCGEITSPTKVCFYGMPDIEIDVIKPFDVYSPIKNLQFSYKTRNFSDGVFSYSFNNKEYKPYTKLSDSGTISFNLRENYEGIVYLRFEVENIAGEKFFKQFEIKYDGIAPRIVYEWLELKSQYYNQDFKDKLKVQCLDNFLGIKPLTIYLRGKENEQFEKVTEGDSSFLLNFNFEPYESIQFKFICEDLGGNQSEVITPLYILDKTSPKIEASCATQKESNQMKINIKYNISDNQSGVEDIEIVLYKDDKYYNLLYKGVQGKRSFEIVIAENGNFGVEFIAKDRMHNISRLRPDACSFMIDLTPPTIKVEIPKFSKYPDNKTREITYSATDNTGVDRIELIEIIKENEITLSATKQPAGIFTILPENKENLRKFKVKVYDKSGNSTFYDFSIHYKTLTLSYPILNNAYITGPTFNIDYNLTDDTDLLEDVLLLYSYADREEFVKYGSVLENKKITLDEGCYKLAVIGVSKFGEKGDMHKFAKKICVITQKPLINIRGTNTVFYGKKFVKIPFEVSSLELNEDSIEVFWSVDRGLSWEKVNKLFRARDEVIIEPSNEGQVYVKIRAKNKAGLENELILEKIFVSSQPPLCLVEDKLIFNTSEVNFKYEVHKKFIPLQYVTISIIKDGVEVQTIKSTEEKGIVNAELKEGVYTLKCTSYDIAGNYSEVNLGKMIVDYTPPQINISEVEVERIDKNRAYFQIKFKFYDSISTLPYKIGIYSYNFATKRWKQLKVISDFSTSEDVLKISVPLFGRFSFALTGVDQAGNKYIQESVLARKPSTYIMDLRRPKPKISSPQEKQIFLFGDSMPVKWQCGKSALAEYSNMYILNSEGVVKATIFEQYPSEGSYEYFPNIEEGEYLLQLVCTSKYGIEFRTTRKFYVIEKLPEITIKPYKENENSK